MAVPSVIGKMGVYFRCLFILHSFLFNKPPLYLHLPQWHMRSCGWMYRGVYSPSYDPPDAIRSVQEGSRFLEDNRVGCEWIHAFILYYFVVWIKLRLISLFILLFFEANGFPVVKEKKKKNFGVRRRLEVGVSRVCVRKTSLARPRDNGIGWEITSPLTVSRHYV